MARLADILGPRMENSVQAEMNVNWLRNALDTMRGLAAAEPVRTLSSEYGLERT